MSIITTSSKKQHIKLLQHVTPAGRKTEKSAQSKNNTIRVALCAIMPVKNYMCTNLPLDAFQMQSLKFRPSWEIAFMKKLNFSNSENTENLERENYMCINFPTHSLHTQSFNLI